MNIKTITATLEDDSVVVLFPAAPVVPPTEDPIVEVDIKTASGTEEVFVPQA